MNGLLMLLFILVMAFALSDWYSGPIIAQVFVTVAAILSWVIAFNNYATERKAR